MASFHEIRSQLRKRMKLYRSLYADTRTPTISKILLWAAIGYFFLPFDIIPDFIPILGQLDDAIIIPILLFLALRAIPKGVYEEHYDRIFKKLG